MLIASNTQHMKYDLENCCELLIVLITANRDDQLTHIFFVQVKHYYNYNNGNDIPLHF